MQITALAPYKYLTKNSKKFPLFSIPVCKKITSIPCEFNVFIKELHILESLKITTLFIDSF